MAFYFFYLKNCIKEKYYIMWQLFLWKLRGLQYVKCKHNNIDKIGFIIIKEGILLYFLNLFYEIKECLKQVLSFC